MTVAAELEPLNPVAPSLSAEQQARADSYRLLGALLGAAPGADLLDLLRALRVDDAAGEGGGELTGAWVALREAALASDVEALSREYWDLFIGLGRGELLPYASYYLTGFLMEAPLAELRSQLSLLGFAQAEAVSEPEDHAAALCEVMAELIGNGHSIGEQQALFERFIAPWMGQFFADLQLAETAGFYRAVGQFGERFLALDQEYFSMPV